MIDAIASEEWTWIVPDNHEQAHCQNKAFPHTYRQFPAWEYKKSMKMSILLPRGCSCELMNGLERVSDQ